MPRPPQDAAEGGLERVHTSVIAPQLPAAGGPFHHADDRSRMSSGALDLHTQQVVAIKTVRVGDASPFMHEVALLAELEHPEPCRHSAARRKRALRSA